MFILKVQPPKGTPQYLLSESAMQFTPNRDEARRFSNPAKANFQKMVLILDYHIKKDYIIVEPYEQKEENIQKTERWYDSLHALGSRWTHSRR